MYIDISSKNSVSSVSQLVNCDFAVEFWHKPIVHFVRWLSSVLYGLG